MGFPSCEQMYCADPGFARHLVGVFCIPVTGVPNAPGGHSNVHPPPVGVRGYWLLVIGYWLAYETHCVLHCILDSILDIPIHFAFHFGMRFGLHFVPGGDGAGGEGCSSRKVIPDGLIGGIFPGFPAL